jgi:dienelactone hydrolase
MERIYVDSDGQKMEGTLFVPEGAGPFPAILIFPGCGSNEKRFFDMAEQHAARGIFAMTINPRGHGESEGVFGELMGTAHTLDGFAAYDFLAARPEVDPERIGLSGSSYGAMIAARISAERPVKSLILRAPAAYTDKMLNTPLSEIMAEEKEKFFMLSASDIAQSPAVRAMEEFTGSLLVVASGNDDIIPPSIPQAYYDHATIASRREIETLAGAPHSLTPSPVHKQQFNDCALTWFSETL